MTIATALPKGWSVGTNLASMLGNANPYTAGLQAITSLFGGQSVKQSAGGANGSVVSGVGNSLADNSVKFKSSQIDLENPLHIAGLAAGIVGAVWLFHKIK